MSISASIDLNWIPKSEFNYPLIHLIQMFLKFGWSLNYEGQILYLPLGDNGDFDWQKDDINEDEIFSIFAQKESCGETIGITMMWGDTDIGGDFLFQKDCSLSMLLSINRKTCADITDITDITDVNWYLSKILPVLNSTDFKIESFSFNQSI